MEKYIYSGAGNTFVVLDARNGIPEIDVQSLCANFSTDGLMLLKKSDGYDFAMEYFNSDGSSGMMCGNGGRCIVSFAEYLGIAPNSLEGMYRFIAPDGEHTAKILPDGNVCLKMRDVSEYAPSVDGGWFVDTGTRHYVKFVSDVEAVDVQREGRYYRCLETFAPIGVNANFVQLLSPDTIKVRTFEKGVEAETMACGTGITASAIAAYLNGNPCVEYIVKARKDTLSVSFVPKKDRFREVYLTGPAVLVRVVE